MKEFLGDDFLLTNEVAKDLFHNHAAKMPIFDFHCHLIPREIYEDKPLKSITEAWLGANGFGDHYKWRLLREMGIPEEYITGQKTDKERFDKFAECMPYFIGNPIYQWTHLELRRYFGVTKLLCKENADEIYEQCNEVLKTLTPRKMMEKFNVATVYTTDDPVDDLHYHELMAKDQTLKTNVLPCWRPDKALNVERSSFIPWIKQLEVVSGQACPTLKEMLTALDGRMKFFVDHGCVATDHALDVVHYKKGVTYEEANLIYQKGLKGLPVSFEEEDAYKGFVMLHLGRLYYKYNLVMQLHIGALRNNSERNFLRMGPDTGYDAVEDLPFAEKLAHFLSELDSHNELPKTVLYTLNSKDYEPLVTLMNCFQGGMKGKIQLGTAWWFNDHFEGMKRQLDVLSADGLLSCFIGMLTDSRSFLSYPRHEYFRREVCDYMGRLVEEGKYPDNRKILAQVAEDISFNNANAYFKR